MHQNSSASPANDKLPTTVSPRGHAMLIAEFQQFALKEHDLNVILQQACRVAAMGVPAACIGVMQCYDDEQVFVLQAGIGWPGHQIGQTRVAADFGTAAGACWILGQLVYFRDATRMGRLRLPETMIERGVSGLVSVPIQTEDLRFGVLQVGSSKRGSFDGSDLSFLTALAMSLAFATSRHADKSSRSSAVRLMTEQNSNVDVDPRPGPQTPYHYQQAQQIDHAMAAKLVSFKGRHAVDGAA